MTAKQLTDSILQMAIQGKLVPQNPNDEPASVLLERIREEKLVLAAEGKLKKKDIEKAPIEEDEIPYDLPQGWAWCRVRDISESFIGLTYKPTDVSTNGWIVLRSSNIQEGLLDYKDIVKVNVDVPAKLRVRTNDIIICARNGSKKLVGKSALVREVNMPMTFGAFMAICRTQFYEYMSKYLLSPFFFQQLRKDSDTTTICQLTQKNFNNYLVPLPPLAEQHRIIEKIEEYLPIIKEYGEAYDEALKMDAELADKLKKSILQEAIMGKLGTNDPSDVPASSLLTDIRTEKQKLVVEGLLKKKDLIETPVKDDEVLFNIPENWEWVRAKDCCSMIFSGKSPSYSKIPTKNLIIGQQANQWNGIDMNYVKYGTDDYVKNIAEYQYLIDGDVLLNSLGNGTLGRCGIFENVKEKVLTDGHLFVFRCLDKVTAKYILFYLTLNYTAINKGADGSTNQTFLNLKKVSNYIIPLPPLAEQHRIVQKIEELYAEIDNMRVENNIIINEKEEKDNE